MENNFYKELSKDIKLNLPDINFDSDSDELMLNSDEPIKPFIRPPAEILFGNDDLNDDEKDVLQLLTRLPSNLNEDNDRKPETTKPNECLETDINSNGGQMVIPEDKCDSKGIPYNNCNLGNGLRTFENSNAKIRIKESDRVVLTDFGIRDDIDLDKILEEMDLNQEDSSFFDDALLECESTNNNCQEESTESELLKKLDEMSKKYRQNSNILSIQQFESTKLIDRLSLDSFFDKIKVEENANDTVVLDLRNENLNWKNATDDEEIVEKPSTAASDSSEEEKDNEYNDTTCLWIENYRKAKLASTKRKNVVNENENIRTTMKIEKKDPEPQPIIAVNCKEIVISESEIKKVEIKTEEEPKKMSENVRIKIENIKRREQLLSERRQLIYRLSEILSANENHQPLLLHEEITFDDSKMELSLTLNNENCKESGDSRNYFNAYISISPPWNIMTNSKVPIPLSADFAASNFVYFLYSVLTSTVETVDTVNCSSSSASLLPFQVSGMHQLYDAELGQMQLVLLGSTVQSISKLKVQLKRISLKKLFDSTDTTVANTQLSTLPLANFIRIQPYDHIVNGNIWCWDLASISWNVFPSSSDCFGGGEFVDDSAEYFVNNCLIVIQPNFYCQQSFVNFLLRLLDRFYFTGIRLVFEKNSPKFVLIVRGYNAVSIIKSNSIVLKEKDLISCTRFEESFQKEAAKYFGPRLNLQHIKETLTKYGDIEGARLISEAANCYRSVYRVRSGDVVLLASNWVLDVGWAIHTVLESSGLMLVWLGRLKQLEAGQLHQLGLPPTGENGQQLKQKEKCNDDNQSGVWHIMVLRAEVATNVVTYCLRACHEFMSADMNQNCLFHALPYSSHIFDILNLKTNDQLPEIREPNCQLPKAPFPDCEQYALVLLCSRNLALNLSQLLDQTAHLDLLAIKILPSAMQHRHQQHCTLLLTEFNLSHIPPGRCCLLVFRSMFLHSELDKVRANICTQRDLVFAFTLTAEITFRLIGSFFTSCELISDDRRRSSLKFLPVDLIGKISGLTLIGQMEYLYQPITSALTIQLKDCITSRFRKIWFMLNREDFQVDQVIMDANCQITFILNRPNAIFFLVQWSKNYFNDSNSLQISVAQQPEDVPIYLEQVSQLRLSIQHTVTDSTDSALICIKQDLLDSSVGAVSNMKIFWTFMEDNNYKCHFLFSVHVTGSTIYKLTPINLTNMQSVKIQEGKYVCLVVHGPSASVVCKDMMRSRFQLMKSDKDLSEGIYVTSEVSNSCDILL